MGRSPHIEHRIIRDHTQRMKVPRYNGFFGSHPERPTGVEPEGRRQAGSRHVEQ